MGSIDLPSVKFKRRDERRPRDSYKIKYSKEFVDPFPEIGGSVIEKMVYADLIRREIPFWFQYKLGDLDFTPWIEHRVPDFYIPSTKTILRVQGEYFHTQDAQITKDAWEKVYMEAMGYKVYDLWEWDVERGVDGLLDQIHEIKNPVEHGGPLGIGDTTDYMARLATALSRRFRPPAVRGT